MAAQMALDDFKNQLAQEMQLLKQATAAGDNKAVAFVARAMGTDAACTAAIQLGKLSLDLEQAAGGDDSTFLERQLILVNEEAARCAAYIEQAKQRVNPSTQPTK
jgi:hypothetical protein